MGLRSAPRVPLIAGGAFLAAAVAGFVVVALIGGGSDHDDAATPGPTSIEAGTTGASDGEEGDDRSTERPSAAAAGVGGEDDPLVRVPYLSLAVVDEIPVDPPLLLGPTDDDLAGVIAGSDVDGVGGGAGGLTVVDPDLFDASSAQETVEAAAESAREFADAVAAVDDPDELEAFLDAIILVDEIVEDSAAPAVFLPMSSIEPGVEDDAGVSDGPVLDVCADVPGWCGEGVGGTVLLALEAPILILDVRPTNEPECNASFDGRFEEFVGIDVTLSRPATMIITSQSLDGSFTSRRERVPQPEEEAAWTAAHDGAGPAELVPITLCRPMGVSQAGDISTYSLTVESSSGRRSPVGNRLEIDDVWRGIIQIPGFGEPPNVRVVPESLGTVRVEVPTTAQWRADLLTVDLGALPEDMSSGDAASACAEVEAVRRAEVDPVAIGGDPEPRFGIRRDPRSSERVEVGPWAGSPPEWRFLETHRIGVGASGGPVAICVRWTDEPHSTTGYGVEPVVRRRQSVLVRAPELPEITAWIVGYRPVYRSVDAERFRADIPAQVEVDLWVPGIACRASAAIPTYPAMVSRADRPIPPMPLEAVELCRFEDRPQGLPFPVITSPVARSGWLVPGTTFTGAIDSSIGLACRHVVDCRVVADVPVHRAAHPDEIRRRRTIDGDSLSTRLIGHVRIGYTITGGGPPPRWAVGLAETYGDADEQPEAPVLSLSSAQLSTVEDCVDEPLPAPRPGATRTERLAGQVCWARTLEVSWSADRPVRLVEGYLMPEFDRELCPPVRFGGSPDATIAMTHTVGDLCPGETYWLGLDVVDPATGARSRYGPWSRHYPWPAAPDAEAPGWQQPVQRIWDVPATLPRVTAQITGWSIEVQAFAMLPEDDGTSRGGIAFKLRRLLVDGGGGLTIRTGHEFGSNGGCVTSRLRTSGDDVTEDGRAARLGLGGFTSIEFRGTVLHQSECWLIDPTGDRTTHGFVLSSFGCTQNVSWEVFAAASLLDEVIPARIGCSAPRRVSASLDFEVVPGGLRPPARSGVDGRPPMSDG